MRDIEAGDRGDYVCVAMAQRYINIARVTLSVRGKSSPSTNSMNQMVGG